MVNHTNTVTWDTKAAFSEKRWDVPMEKGILEKRVAFLKGIVPFQNLSNDELAILASRFQYRAYKHRDFIIHQGDNSQDLFVIKTGKVRVLTLNPAGEESCLRVFATGDIFGELSACDGIPRSATIQSLGECSLLVMGQHDFTNFLRGMPDLSIAFIRFLTEKLRWMTMYSHTIAQYDTAGRLLHTLLHYNDMLGRELVAGQVYEFDLSLNQADLASMVGARREWANRLLQRWRKKGLLVYDRGKITILNLPAVVAERDRRLLMEGGEPW